MCEALAPVNTLSSFWLEINSTVYVIVLPVSVFRIPHLAKGCDSPAINHIQPTPITRPLSVLWLHQWVWTTLYSTYEVMASLICCRQHISESISCPFYLDAFLKGYQLRCRKLCFIQLRDWSVLILFNGGMLTLIKLSCIVGKTVWCHWQSCCSDVHRKHRRLPILAIIFLFC